MTLTVTILGCGSSGGVPRVGSGWGACDPANPKNRRRRCSILVERTGEAGTTTVLVDTSPDLREQLLDADVRRLDAVLFTHEHADHTHGIDDLRPLAIHMRRRIPIYADHVTGEMLGVRFGYCFRTPAGSDYPPILTEHRIAAGVPVTIDGPGGGLTGLPFALRHGQSEALGFRFGDFAYVNDVSAVPDETVPVLSGLARRGRRRLAPYAASDPFLGLRGARLHRAHSAAACRADQHAYRRRLCRPRVAAAGRRRASLRRHAPRAAAAVKTAR